MFGAELLPKWKQELAVKPGAPVSVFRVSIKDYVAWHTRISILIFFCVLVGTGAVVGVVTTLYAVGDLSNPESGFLSTSFAALEVPSDRLVLTSNTTNAEVVSSTDAEVVSSTDAEVVSSTDAEVVSSTDAEVVSSTDAEVVSSTDAEVVSSTDAEVVSSTDAEVVSSTDAEVVSSTDAEVVSSTDAEVVSSTDAELESSTDAELESIAPEVSFEDADDSYVEREELPPSFTSDFVLEPNPVDLSSLSDVYHSVSDERLLRRASAVPRRATFPPKLAYMFLTRGPLPLSPLWERYFKGHAPLYSIYIHAHPNYRPSFPSNSVFYRRNIPSKEVFWGKLSVFAAERRLLANALLDPANERFILLSESCIPIAPLPVAYQYFTHSRHSFVEAYFQAGRGCMGRYTRIKDRRKMKPEIKPKQWRKGSQWFEMARALALLVVSDRKYYPKYEKFLCKGDHVCYIDEHYLPTVLTIRAPSRLANRTATYIDFSRNTAHPKQWDGAVIDEEVLKKITSGHSCNYNGSPTEMCYMFARKFSPSALGPLLELAATSLGIP